MIGFMETSRQTVVAGAISVASYRVANAILVGSSKVANANQAAGHEIASGIMKASAQINQGLVAIASELEQQRIFNEGMELSKRIEGLENWLYERGKLAEFYRILSEESDKFFYPVPTKYISVLSAICGGKQENINVLMQNALLYNCHPLVYVAVVLERRKLVIDASRTDIESPRGPWDFGISIDGTSFSWRNEGLLKNGKCDNYDEYRQILKSSDVSVLNELQKLYHCTKFTLTDMAFCFEKDGSVRGERFGNVALAKVLLSEEQIEQYVVALAEMYENPIYLPSENEILNWKLFFHKLNIHIAMDNMRTLFQELSAYVRKMMIEGSV